MSGKVIGKSLNYGFAGAFARTPDMVIETRSAESNIKFGDPVIAGATAGSVKKADATLTAANFVGIAGAEVKSAFDYANQGEGSYKQYDATPVMQRGSINVVCKNGTPALYGPVYVAITTSAFTGAEVGDIMAAGTGTLNTDYIQLTNAQWGGPKDANGVAELVLLTRVNA